MGDVKHCRVDLIPTRKPKGFASAAIRSCSGCGEILSAMGGGGLYLCEPCIKVLSFGLLQREFREQHEAMEK